MPVVRFPQRPTGKQGQSRNDEAARAAATRVRNEPAQKRKLIAFDAETWSALDLLSRDSMKSIQELADEAFTDLLKKHHRPTDVKQALRESARLASLDEKPHANSKRPRPPTKPGRSRP